MLEDWYKNDIYDDENTVEKILLCLSSFERFCTIHIKQRNK